MHIDLDNLDDLTPEQRAAIRQAARDAGLPAVLAQAQAAQLVRETTAALSSAADALAAARAECEPRVAYLSRTYEAQVAESKALHEEAMANALKPLRDAQAAHAQAQAAHAAANAANEAGPAKVKKR